MRRHWKAIVVLAAVAALGLSVVAVAWGAGAGRGHARSAGACETLMSNPQAIKEMHALRVVHQNDMRTWSARYGSEPKSAAARAALQKLMQSRWDDMKALFKKYGIKVPAGAGLGVCGGTGGMMGSSGACAGGSCGGLGGGGSSGGSTQGTVYGQGMMGSGGGMMRVPSR